jgi:hypothetical protein
VAKGYKGERSDDEETSTLLIGLLMMAMSSAPALAQGQVERGPDHANSICSFSGQNDDPSLRLRED